MRRLCLIATLAVLGGATGCAHQNTPANWQNPDVPKDSWNNDIGDCRRYAKREVQREAGIPAMAPLEDNLGGGLGQYQQSMNRFELSRIQSRAFDACMRRLGYTPIVGK